MRTKTGVNYFTSGTYRFYHFEFLVLSSQTAETSAPWTSGLQFTRIRSVGLSRSGAMMKASLMSETSNRAVSGDGVDV